MPTIKVGKKSPKKRRERRVKKKPDWVSQAWKRSKEISIIESAAEARELIDRLHEIFHQFDYLHHLPLKKKK